MPLSTVDMYCGADWADVDLIVFVLVAEWSPWIFDYVAYVDALAPQIEAAGGRVVFVGAHNERGGLLTGAATDRLLADLAPKITLLFALLGLTNADDADVLLGIVPNPYPNNWINGTDPCSWTRVTCNGRG